MYSTDYPYTYETGYEYIETSGGVARSFLENSPFSGAQIRDIGSGNWEALVRQP